MYILSSETQWYREIDTPNKKVVEEMQPKARHNHSTFYFSPEQAREELSKVAHKIKEKVIKGEIFQDGFIEEEYSMGGVFHIVLARPDSNAKIQITVTVGVGMYTIPEDALNILKLHGYNVGKN
jgi:hypothetical protein